MNTERGGSSPEYFGPIDSLPTTGGIAYLGVQEFKSVAQHIQDPNLLRHFISYTPLQRLFTGVTPEISNIVYHHQYKYSTREGNWRHHYERDSLSLQSAIQEFTHGNFLFVSKEAYDEDTQQPYTVRSAYNLRAAQRVIDLHPDCFPWEARQNMKQWLVQQKLSENEVNREKKLQYALLSGIPMRAALDEMYSLKYPGGEDQLQFVAEQSWGFRSGNPGRDNRYLREVFKIFNNSGIKDIAGKIKAEHQLE